MQLTDMEQTRMEQFGNIFGYGFAKNLSSNRRFSSPPVGVLRRGVCYDPREDPTHLVIYTRDGVAITKVPVAQLDRCLSGKGGYAIRSGSLKTAVVGTLLRAAESVSNDAELLGDIGDFRSGWEYKAVETAGRVLGIIATDLAKHLTHEQRQRINFDTYHFVGAD